MQRTAGRPPRHRGVGTASRRLTAFVATAAVSGLLVAGLLAPAALTVDQAASVAGSVFDALPSTLPAGTAAATSVVLDASGAPIAYLYAENRTPVPLAAMSPLVQEAIVAVEDARFFQHGAADPKGLLRAVVNDASGGSTEGASTLTQQYVKNALLEQAVLTGDTTAERAAVARTPARKLTELRLAVSVEQQLTKQQILERYLNIVYFGEGAYGVQAAAERYFGVPASGLDLPQAALLAGLVQDPAAYDPAAHPAAARARRDVVLRDLLAQHQITPEQLRVATGTPVAVAGHPLSNGCAAAGTSGFFCEYVLQSLLTDPRYAALGATPVLRERALRTGGLVIRTTLDRTAQAAAVRATDRIPPTDPSGLGASAVTVEPGTGAVTAMAQNRTYSDIAGPGRTSVNYGVDAALGGGRGFQTGSSFKPFVLATWLQHGHTLDDTVDATRRAFPFSDFTACGHPLAGGSYRPGNSEGTESGPMSVLSATANSVNVAYVAMEAQLDLCDVAGTAQALGVHLAAPEQECSPRTAPTTLLPTCLPSLTLGVKDIAPLTMAAAYAGFAAGGVYCAPSPVTAIEHRAGSGRTTTLARYAPQCHRALPTDVASGVDDALQHVLTDGTAAAVGPLDPWPSAGKTGTTDGPYDTWFVGYTAQRATAVWVGDPGRTHDGALTRRRLTDITVAGHRYGTVFGATLAAPIWRQLMTDAMTGLPPRELP